LRAFAISIDKAEFITKFQTSLNGSLSIYSSVKTIRLTAKGRNILYLHLFTLFKSSSVLLPIQAAATKASILANGQKVNVTTTDTGLMIDLSQLAIDDHVTTIELNFAKGYQMLAVITKYDPLLSVFDHRQDAGFLAKTMKKIKMDAKKKA